MMTWEEAILQFKHFLQLERSMSAHSVSAYLGDIKKLAQYLGSTNMSSSPLEVSSTELHGFVEFLGGVGMAPRSQARIISGIKSFYKFLLFEDFIEKDPSKAIGKPQVRAQTAGHLKCLRNRIVVEFDRSFNCGRCPESSHDRDLI